MRAEETAGGGKQAAGAARPITDVNFSTFSYIDDDQTPGKLTLEMTDDGNTTTTKEYDPPHAVDDSPGEVNIKTVEVSRKNGNQVVLGLPWTGNAPAGSFFTSVEMVMLQGRLTVTTKAQKP